VPAARVERGKTVELNVRCRPIANIRTVVWLVTLDMAFRPGREPSEVATAISVAVLARQCAKLDQAFSHALKYLPRVSLPLSVSET